MPQHTDIKKCLKAGARRAATWVAAFVVGPVVLLTALEGIVRLTAQDDLALRNMEEELIEWRGGRLSHVNRAGYRGALWSRPVTIDSLGLRSAGSRGARAAPARLRLLLIGDSVMFGLGLADEDAPAAVLSEYLDPTVRILNAAVIGYSTEHEVAFLNEFGDRLRPDVVLLGYCVNDARPGDREALVRFHEIRDQLPWIQAVNLWALRHSLLYLRLKDLLHAYRWRHGYAKTVRPLYGEASWQRNRQAVLQLVQWCRRRQVPFHVVVFPHRDQLLALDGVDDTPQELLDSLGRESGFRVLDLRSVLDPADYLASDPVHLDKRGMRKAMQAVAAFCRNDLSHCSTL